LNILFFTRYTDYLGTFVMHCHILDHEPLKTMEVVDVVGEGPRSASMATRGSLKPWGARVVAGVPSGIEVILHPRRMYSSIG
jgi:hypothetical protein